MFFKESFVDEMVVVVGWDLFEYCCVMFFDVLRFWVVFEKVVELFNWGSLLGFN